MNNYMFDRLSQQKDEIENILRGYQPPQIPSRDFIEWRVLNENEEVDNLYVSNKTLFVGDSTMVLKGVDGSLQKWDIRKTYPIDKKDEKINALEDEIKKLKEMIDNGDAKSTSTTSKGIKSDANDDGDANGEPTTSSEPIQTNE